MPFPMMSPTDRAIMELGRKEGNTQRVLPPAPAEPFRLNMGGFDASDLMSKPEIRQEETRNQANMVSAPYEEANRKAAENTNPMNAESQNPGKSFLMQFLGRR